GECGAGIGADETGGFDPKTGKIVYHLIEGNYVNGAANAAIGCRSGDQNAGYVTIINNEVTGGGRNGLGSGIGMNGAHASKISSNRTYANHEAGIGLRNGASCDLISGNTAYENNAAGIGLCEGAKVTEISSNEIRDNGAAGIGHDGSKGSVVVEVEHGNRISGNGGAGIGIVSSRVTEIRSNLIENNSAPGITLIAGSTAGLILGNTLDHNGASCHAGISVQDGSSATIKDTTISFSGAVGIGIFDSGTSVTLENCTINDSSQCQYGPNLTVQAGAKVTATGCKLTTTTGSPNIMASDSGTILTMSGCTVQKSAKPGLVASKGANITVRDTLFDTNGADATASLVIDGCEIHLHGVTVQNSPHWGLMISNSTGSIEQCEFSKNAFAGGGQITIDHSDLDLIRNLLHDPAGYHNQIRLVNESSGRIYHNTIIGNATGGAGPGNHGPGDGLFVDASSTADVRNNIFLCLPKGITREITYDNQGRVTAEADVTASTNCFFGIVDGGTIGNRAIVQDPDLTEGYYLRTGSPCIDAAERIRGVNDDFTGRSPDIGAREGEGPCSGHILNVQGGEDSQTSTLTVKSPSAGNQANSSFWSTALPAATGGGTGSGGTAIGALTGSPIGVLTGSTGTVAGWPGSEGPRYSLPYSSSYSSTGSFGFYSPLSYGFISSPGFSFSLGFSLFPYSSSSSSQAAFGLNPASMFGYAGFLSPFSYKGPFAFSW
ncbi:MAG: right-handed parallel beta-helix repeat-containing protein, partial [bacterium]